MHVYENEMKMAMKLFLLQAKLNRYMYLSSTINIFNFHLCKITYKFLTSAQPVFCNCYCNLGLLDCVVAVEESLNLLLCKLYLYLNYLFIY